MILRHGLKVRGLEFRLFYPKPRSSDSAAAGKHGENRITFRPHLYYGEMNKEIDFVFFLNGLPIVDLEPKHEKNQNVHDAVAQFAARDHSQRIFRHPFMYLAADTSDVFVPGPDEEERVYPKGVVSKALMNVAFQDDGLIQYKAEVMLRIFEKDVLPLVGGRTKAMIVTSSRVAGLRYFNVVSIGLIDRSPVHPREVFADALCDRASAIIVAHNHPGGGVEPSPSDINITAQLKAAGGIVGIELLDHIIFNKKNTTVSWRPEGCRLGFGTHPRTGRLC